MTDPSAIDGFTQTTFTHDGKERDVFRRGEGPAVIVIAEIPGITPKVLEFARRVADLGCTAVLPHLFGTPGTVGHARATRLQSDRARLRLARSSPRSPRGKPHRSRSGCGRWPATSTRRAAGPASASSACASPAVSPWR